MSMSNKKPLLERIEKALEDFKNGRAYMHVPVEETDIDIVLHDCRNRIEELQLRAKWRPISEIHEDFGPCILVNLDLGPADLHIGSNLDRDGDNILA